MVCPAGTPAATSRDVVGKYLDTNTSSDIYVGRIGRWLQDCQNHSFCTQYSLSKTQRIANLDTPLPTRCVRVGPMEVDGWPRLRLEETSGKTGKYICLSYRWTSETPGTSTVVANYQNRLHEDSFGSLPLLYRHVVSVAYKLGIRWVWIDSLCIVQDDADDWNCEAGKMGDYYRMAHFTLGAVGVNEGTPAGGLFAAGPLRLAKLPYRDKQGRSRGFFYIHPKPTAGARMLGYKQLISKSDFLSRGWIFQEWLLSRRLVCYTTSGIFLQCQCPNESPLSQLGDDTVYNLRELDGTPDFSIKFALHLDFGSRRKIYDGWRTVVSQYSRRVLTKPGSDRIAALRGIAGEFVSALQHVGTGRDLARADDGRGADKEAWISGLFAGDFHRSLLWEQTTRGTHERLPEFPTWSWASMYTAVDWGLGSKIKPACEILGIVPTNRRQISHIDGTTAILSSTLPDTAAETAASGPTRAKKGPSPMLFHRDIDVTDNDAKLCIRGRLLPVVVRSFFPDEESFAIALAVTGHSATSWSPAIQRTVAVPAAPGIIAGWASLEHPEFQDDAIFAGNCPHIFALLVSKTLGVGPGTTGLGYLGRSHEAMNVLFLRRSDKVENGFERVGVGSLFGREAEAGFREAVGRDVYIL